MINEGTKTFLQNDKRHPAILTHGAALCHLLDELVSCRSRLRSRYRQIPIFCVFLCLLINTFGIHRQYF